jgi:hypothetical protein
MLKTSLFNSNVILNVDYADNRQKIMNHIRYGNCSAKVILTTDQAQELKTNGGTV